MASNHRSETLTHRLILPRDANHHGTLYAGVLLSLALEAAYASAYRSIGHAANLVLKRVLDIRCLQPVPVGFVVELRGREVRRARAGLVIALIGSPLENQSTPWMEGLMQFVQIGKDGRPIELPTTTMTALEDDDSTEVAWELLRARADQLLRVRR